MRVVVIGGGAAGFFGAIACAESVPAAQVTVLEAGGQVLSKVKISGGGRCNVTHACFDPALLVHHYPRGSKALRGPLSRFQPQDTVAWFQGRGVDLKTEADGRMFPVTDRSETIIQCLTQAATAAGVRVQVGQRVQQVQTGSGSAVSQFALQLNAGKTLECDRLLLATGSNPVGYRIAQALGHTLAPPVPSLFTFKVTDERLQGLAGIAVNPVALTLKVEGQKPLKQSGPLLITHWGISGPAVLKLSAWGARLLHGVHYQAILQVNWLPHHTPEQLRALLLAVKATYPRRAIAGSSPVGLPLRLWQALVNAATLKPDVRWADLSHKSLNGLIQELSQGQFRIRGKGIFKDEFVTCGGVQLKEVNFKTMESRCCPGLYLAGEILDIDGVTGGFNFQSAWTTGWIAGQSMGE